MGPATVLQPDMGHSNILGAMPEGLSLLCRAGNSEKTGQQGGRQGMNALGRA